MEMLDMDIKDMYQMEIISADKKKKNNEYDYSYGMIHNSGIDGAWEKKRGDKVIQKLFLLPSQKKYYIIDTSTKSKENNPVAEQLTENSFVNFWNKLSVDEPVTYDHEIFNYFVKSPAFLRKVYRMIDSENFREICKCRAFDIKSFEYLITNDYDIVSIAYPHKPTALETYIRDKALNCKLSRAQVSVALTDTYIYGYGFKETDKLNRHLVEFFNYCEKLYGLDTTKHQFVDKWFQDLDMRIGSYYYLHSIFFMNDFIPDLNHMKNYNGDLEKIAHDDFLALDPKTLSNYLMYELKRQGIYVLSEGINTLKDTYDSQMKVYGKIKEKYPPALRTYHDQMYHKVKVIEDIEECTEYSKHAKEGLKYEGDAYGYSLRILATPSDVVDEAIQMSNCVRNYISHVQEGNCILMTLRFSNMPETSLVTVEIRNDEAVQYYREHDSPLTANDKYALFTILKRYYDRNDMTELSNKMKNELYLLENQISKDLKKRKNNNTKGDE